MTARELVVAVARHGGTLAIRNGRVRVEAPMPLPGPLIAELRAHRDELARQLADADAAADVLADDLAAVLLCGTVVGDVWLVADEEVLAEYPEIIRAGLPVIFFDEVERLRGMPLEGLRTVLGVKCTFPTSRVIQ